MRPRIPIIKHIPFVLCLLLAFPATGIAENTYQVARVIDGDTIKLTNGERVRYIGITTPEPKHPRKGVEHFSSEASAFNKKLVGGKKVRLELDVQKRDRYGRLLAYVYRLDGTFITSCTNC